MKRTKIVCTIGPASSDPRVLTQLMQAGMDVARLNFSHGTHDDHARLFKRLNEVSKRVGKTIGILQDLQGPKIRVGDLPKEGVKLVAGGRAIFSTEGTLEKGDIPVTLETLHRDVRPGERMLFDDGLLEVEVERIVGRRIFTHIVIGGVLLSHKGLNLPGTKLKIPALSEKDRADAIFGAKLGVDYVALSFVRSPDDVKDLRRLLDKQKNGKQIRIIAKIEKKEAVDRFEEILPLVDAVMVARGDLGIETPASQVPIVQKQLIARCRAQGVPVIVATQMLDSMQRNPRPTRAEVSDVANAVQDHADAVMLSGETASGAYPVEAVKMMTETIQEMEASTMDDVSSVSISDPNQLPEVIGATTRVLSDALKHPPIVVATTTGRSAREVSSFRPESDIIAVTPYPHVARCMALVWGVRPVVAPIKKTADQFIKSSIEILKKQRHVKSGSCVIAVTGAPMGKPGSANRIEIACV